MKTSETAMSEMLHAMPDAGLLLRIRRLRAGRDAVASRLAEHRANSSIRSRDWAVGAERKLKDLNAALDQVREEGKRRLKAARDEVNG